MKIKLRVAGLAVACAAVLLGAAACNPDSLTNLNKNPNAPNAVGTTRLFPAGVLGSVYNNLLTTGVFSPRMQLYFGELWAQHMAEWQYPNDDQYAIQPTVVDGFWTGFYSTGLQDYEQILRQVGDSVNVKGPTLIMKSWTYQYATDIWGDLPYSQANQGDKGNITPVYDTQQAIYNGIFKDLTDANTMMTGTAQLGTGDIIYGGGAGSVLKWRKFANSLHARAALHLVKVDPTKAQAEMVKAFAGPVFESNDDQAQLNWPGDGAQDSPYSVNFQTRDDQRTAETLIDSVLVPMNDPRLPVFAMPTERFADSALGPEFNGLPNGLSATVAFDSGRFTSMIGEYFQQPETPSILMSYAELLFIKAEAQQRGWIAGSAAASYTAGITASMEFYGVSAGDIAAYLAQPSVVYTPATGLQQIALQKWIALFGDGIESWTTYRLAGTPNLKPAVEAQTNPKIVPRRLEYPLSEQSYNDAHLVEAKTRQTSDSKVTRLWWDKP
jgi:hypothetical protein